IDNSAAAAARTGDRSRAWLWETKSAADQTIANAAGSVERSADNASARAQQHADAARDMAADRTPRASGGTGDQGWYTRRDSGLDMPESKHTNSVLHSLDAKFDDAREALRSTGHDLRAMAERAVPKPSGEGLVSASGAEMRAVGGIDGTSASVAANHAATGNRSNLVLAYGLSGLLALAASVAGTDSSGERVIGGMQATEGMFPFMVHLYKDGSPYCGGTLIDAEWVLTAAHCVAQADSNSSGAGSFVPTNPALFKVGYGTNSGSLGDYVEVDSIVVSTGFDPVWYTSDIALVKIKSNNDLITKAKSTTVSTASIMEGQTVITAGWGQTTNDNTEQSSALMYAGLVVADDDTCKAAAVDWNGQNGRYVCTSFSTAPGIGTCFGDSGGPLLLSTGGGYTLLGIVSFD
ncbi:Chymotrypsin-like elastase member 2A, partial [Coemansia sp. RSA 1853]